MFSFDRLWLNFRTLSIQGSWAVTKAKKEYLKKHPECALCGSKKHLEVHHIYPVHLFPTRATDLTNMITLCDPINAGCHYAHGHFFNFKTKYNPLIRELVTIVRLSGKNNEQGTVFSIPIEEMVKEFASSKGISEKEWVDTSLSLISPS